MLKIIFSLLKELDSGKGHMPPTLLYNEGWLLKVLMHWFCEKGVEDHPLACLTGASWFTEGMLSTRFLPQYRGDELAESYTRADGVMGHIAVGKAGKRDIFLVEPFEQFAVLEAKLFSRLESGTARAPGYNQAARCVACMASVLEDNKRFTGEFSSLGFYVLAPEKQLNDEPTFYEYMQKRHIYETVLSRIELYKERSNYLDKRGWFENYFEPLLKKINLLIISWEEIVYDIKQVDSETGKEFGRFYERCLAFNKPL